MTKVKAHRNGTAIFAQLDLRAQQRSVVATMQQPFRMLAANQRQHPASFAKTKAMTVALARRELAKLEAL
jgi:hypothetical protein